MDNNAQKKLQRLFINYSKKLPNKIYNIDLQWQQLLSHWDLNEVKNFHREIHSLCGSAGTYGYLELSDVARKMEIFLKDILERQTILDEEQNKIYDFIEQLKRISTATIPTMPTVLEKTVPVPIENRLVYLVEQDEDVIVALQQHLGNAGFTIQTYYDLPALQCAVAKKSPLALIISTIFLEKTNSIIIDNIRKNHATPIPLFCIVPDSNLLPRLQAVRAGCDAFFQKPIDIYLLIKTLNQKCSLITDMPYRILIVDASESLAQYYALVLNQAGMITHAISNPLLLLQEMEQFHPNLLLMDIYMPGCTGLELAAILRQENQYTKIPIIFLSTEDNKRKQLSAINLGSDDFLTKPIAPQQLISAVKSRSKRAGILNYYKSMDSLTGLLNHTTILSQVGIELSYTKQYNQPLSFIIIDIDLFKSINDTHGHPAGDMVIQKLANLLVDKLRNDDLIGRYGGEEFAVILPRTTKEQSTAIFTTLKQQFANHLFTVDNDHFSVTFSAGISEYHSDHHSCDIVIEAERALQTAKQQGRNQIVVYDRRLHAE